MKPPLSEFRFILHIPVNRNLIRSDFQSDNEMNLLFQS
ncbi:hypothetical protein FGIG_05111 [Fasciola gigantica]|uniref:Uncharacterized protein n=1 Tax=Fasciola gigantica TaxID=46835 RepID=A0A504YBA1_FASGI|nr:hypothetical protein FGIG_05111 [Fasciola gigantica]